MAFRGSAQARIDRQGRLKVPASFLTALEQKYGLDVFVTSLTGQCVRIYPLSVWIEVEHRLSATPTNHPSRLKFLDRVNYYGQASTLDRQGRVVITAHLRERGEIVGLVRVLGRIDHLEVWNEERLKQKLHREPWADEDGLKLSDQGV